MNKRKAGDIDAAIGKKIRKLRIASGLTMQEFAGQMGITQQQAHKYEKGTNRVAVSRLYQMSEILNTSVSYFFEDFYDDMEPRVDSGQRKNMELIKYFQAIPSLKHQDAVRVLVRVLSEQ